MTEPFGPIQRGLVSRQFNNVLDLDASRKVKQATGKAVSIKKNMGADSPEMTKHEDEAMALTKPVPVKKSKFNKVMDYLGLGDPNV